MDERIIMKQVSRDLVREDWLRLNKGNSHTTPFQQWELHSIIAHHYLFFFLSKREWPCYFAFYKEDKIILIAPMCRRYSIGGVKYFSFGATPTIAFQDFIYDDELTADDMQECLDLLYNKCKDITFYNLPSDSLLLETLKRKRPPPIDKISISTFR